MKNDIQNIKEELLTAINSGTLKQRPKYYYVFFSILSMLGIITVCTLLLYFLSFMILVFREQHLFQTLGLSGREIFNFMHKVPLLLIVFITLLLITLFILIHHYRISYQQPILYSISAILFLTVIITVGLILFDTKMRLARWGENSRLPLLHNMHKHYRPRRPMPPPMGEIRVIRVEVAR